MNDLYKKDLKLPLMERIKKKKEYKNLFKDKKPTKRKYIYPNVKQKKKRLVKEEINNI